MRKGTTSETTDKSVHSSTFLEDEIERYIQHKEESRYPGNINGANAASGTPCFTENPGDPYKAWDASTTIHYMPSRFITWRLEYNHRAAISALLFGTASSATPPILLGGSLIVIGGLVITFWQS